jgi:integrase
MFEENLRRELDKIKQLKHGNDKILLSFLDKYTFKKKTLSISRKSRFLYSMHEFAQILDKPLTDFKGKEIIQVMDALVKKQNKRGRDFSPHTWKEYRKDLLVWIKFVNPPEVWFREINDPKTKKALEITNPYTDKDYNKKIKKNLLTDEEVLSLLQAGNTQEKAIIAVLAFTGIRPLELVTLKPSSVKFCEDGSAMITLEESKTFTREIKLRADLAVYLKDWLNAGGGAAETLFHNKKKPLANERLNYLVKSLCVKSGLGKFIANGLNGNGRRYNYQGQTVTPYSFRRYHARWCIRNMRPETASKRLWGNVNSKMVGVYLGLDDADAHEDYDKASGGQPAKPKTQFLEGNYCPKCRNAFPATVKVCPACNVPISPDFVYAPREIDYNKVFERMDKMLDLKYEQIAKAMKELADKSKK